MRWIFGIVGLVIGALGGGVAGAFFGALIGVGLASLILHMDKRASSQWANPPQATETRAQAPAAAPGATTLQERVARLEHEVSLLRRQIAEIKGGTFAAPATVISGLYPRYTISESCYKELYSIMQKDKKNQSGKINCTLLTSIGQCRIDNICTEDELYAGLDYYSTLNNVLS